MKSQEAQTLALAELTFRVEAGNGWGLLGPTWFKALHMAQLRTAQNESVQSWPVQAFSQSLNKH